ncbi:MAG TPA: transposase, partial [Lacipirellulaceae bacterium]|nr:transposase [Lacipirellulaceae bacterium]
RRLLAATIRRHMNRKKRVARAAMDSTGLEASPASPYFVRRRAATGSPWKSMVYHRFPKLSILCTTDSHFVLGYRSSRGPCPDVVDFQPLLADALQCVRLTAVIADAGYDSEANHRFGRESCQVRTVIPAKRGPQTNKPAQGRYRRLMQARFDADFYRDRCQAETVVSMIKRRQDSFLRTRNYWSQCRDLRLKVLTHNIMILKRTKVFYRAGQSHFAPKTPQNWDSPRPFC